MKRQVLGLWELTFTYPCILGRSTSVTDEVVRFATEYVDDPFPPKEVEAFGRECQKRIWKTLGRDVSCTFRCKYIGSVRVGLEE